MIKSQFPRLKDSTDIGDYLRSLEEHPVSRQRLLENSERIKARLALGAVGLTGLALILSRLLELKISLPMLGGILLAGTGVFYFSSQGQSVDQQSPYTTPAGVVHTCNDVDDSLDEHICQAPTVREPQVAEQAPPKAMAPRKVHRAPVVDAPIVDEPAPSSGLPTQLAMYDMAKRMGAKGHYRQAIEVLGKLIQRFPQSALRAEAELSEVEYLARLQNAAEAIPKIKKLLNRPEHQGRKGELTRVLGDLYRESGNCDQATTVYNHASTLKLSTADAIAVKEGRKICEKSTPSEKKTEPNI